MRTALPGTTLWKYFPRKRFDSMLEDGALYFRRVMDFADDDPLEGTIPERDKAIDQAYVISEHIQRPMAPDTLKARLDSAVSIEGWGTLESVIINCWTMCEEDTHHMWRLFAQDEKATKDEPAKYGVAIRTRIELLPIAFANQPMEILGSAVRYIDHRTERFYAKDQYEHGTENVLVPIIHKHKAFEAEREFRLMHQFSGGFKAGELWDAYDSGRAKKITVNLPVLISEVMMSPHSTPHHKAEVEALCAAKGITADVRWSKLSPHWGRG